ncbi:pyridoxal-dependent decarboxylase, exosortase A system-associated [Algicola sagamiensis]|uniref:pyridoxal-dependent decarboxylase, exosortase A system-associated n=1 Tax=Algicola sagamiensis TaxID=163869 RepID=UPI0003607F55|nr:pyridoxal-dependent decarboxylase, exosortase A system-associated [Algicola sagamiensis]
MSLQHDRLTRIHTAANQLIFAGKTTAELAAIAGQTPCYIYDRQLITARIEHLRKMLPKALKLHYAIKANPMPAVVQHIGSQVDGLDVASHKELLTALATGKAPTQISCAGPAKSEKELLAAITSGVIINVESETELQRIEAISHQFGKKAKIAFRVNPAFELKSSGMKMAGGPKQFGIDSEQLPEILTNLDLNRIELHGLHIFSGSQNLNTDALIETHQKTFELAAELAQASRVPFQHINIGGGFGIPYFPGEQALDLAPIAENLNVLMDSRSESIQNSEIVIELGRYIVGEAGIYLCEVTDKKISRGQTFLMTNGGLHHHLSNSGNFGQVIRKNYPVMIANRHLSDELEKVEIVGPLCTPLDIVGAKLELPKAEIGDHIVVFQSGAYGATASPQQFLSQPDLVEIMI